MSRRNLVIVTATVAGLTLLGGLTSFSVADAFATGVSGNVQLNTEVSTSIAMKIASPNDTNPDCMVQSGVTYGVANRYATSNGAEGSKQVDTFDGTVGGADELNTNTSCATLTMDPNTFSSTYSDITVYTNSPTGYAVTLRSATGASPNLVNLDDNTVYIPAGALTEVDGTGEQAGQKIVPGAQNKWAYKTDGNGNINNWTAVTTTDTTIRAYDIETDHGSTTRVTYGISAGNNPAGRYGTTLTYTATMFDGENPYVPSANITGGSEGSETCDEEDSECEKPHFNVNPAKLPVPYNTTRSFTITPEEGYYIDSIVCSDGYTCADENGNALVLGPTAINPITVYVTNTNKEGTGNIVITTKPVEYQVAIATGTTDDSNQVTFSADKLSVPYKRSRAVTVTPAAGYYLESVNCSEGYSCEIEEEETSSKTEDSGDLIGFFTANVSAAKKRKHVKIGEAAIEPQTVIITNKGTTRGTSISFVTAPRHFSSTVSSDANLTITDSNSGSVADLSITYGHSKNVTVTPSEGHYLASVTCPKGYVCTKTDGTAISTGDNETARAAQNIRISNSRYIGNGTVSFTSGTSTYTVSASATNATVSTASLSIPYGGSKTLIVTPTAGYYLSSYSCPEGYTCTKSDDTAISTGDNAEAQAAQTIKVTNNSTLAGGSLTFTGAKRNLEVAITPSSYATTSTNLISIPYGGSSTFTITPNTGYYLTGVTCSSGYTCSGYSTGSASNPSATSRGAQTITVTNNSSTNTGAVSFTLGNTYRISFSKTNISSPSSSYVDVAYGGSTTVTVTPASGYYLSAFSGCPSGWTCSGVGTGTGYTGAQTLTLRNNSSVNTGTLTISGSLATLASITNMQQMTSSIASNTATGESKSLIDTRDSNSYTVKKLNDGKVWMTQNLRLVGSRTLTSSDSNVSSSFTLAASGSSSTTWCSSTSTTCINKSMVLNSGNTNYGVYYNWYSATAGSGTYSSTSGTAAYSICPKGWRLPTKTELSNLASKYTSASVRNSSGPNIKLSGYRTGKSTTDQGVRGYYWSSSPFAKASVYSMHLDTSDIRPNNSGGKFDGFTIRCIAS